MKKLYAALIALCAWLPMSTPVHAQGQVYLQVSSPTYAGVAVTTGTSVQIDNFRGLKAGRQVARNEILVQNLDATYNIWCGFDTSVSTVTTNVNCGRRIEAGKTVNIALWAGLTYYCQADDAAGSGGVRVHVEQGTWRTDR